MLITCSPIIFTLVLVSVILITTGIGWRRLARNKKEGFHEFDENSVLLFTLMFVAEVSVSGFIFYFFIHSLSCY
jgi:hypothetical protein